MEVIKEKTEEKYFHTENITKNVVTTVIGCVLLIISAVGICMNWFFDFKEIPIVQISVVGAVGFAMLFMRDKISSYLDVFVTRKIEKPK
jgi:hypothetical protein